MSHERHQKSFNCPHRRRHRIVSSPTRPDCVAGLSTGGTAAGDGARGTTARWSLRTWSSEMSSAGQRRILNPRDSASSIIRKANAGNVSQLFNFALPNEEFSRKTPCFSSLVLGINSTAAASFLRWLHECDLYKKNQMLIASKTTRGHENSHMNLRASAPRNYSEQSYIRILVKPSWLTEINKINK